MKTTGKAYILSLLIMFLSGAFILPQNIGTINIEITNLHSNNGEVGIALYNSKKDFPTNPSKSLMQVRVKIENNKCTTSFKGLPYGDYAVSAYHDENNDGKLNFNLFHIPQEGVAASNNAKGHFGPPAYEDAKFMMDSAVINIKMKMLY